ncbi:MAG: hypothetical protein H6Q37_2242, partial [Chloroflexi bacterium]|nr:hypothetical protein [Chloroflexota bacterium]
LQRSLAYEVAVFHRPVLVSGCQGIGFTRFGDFDTAIEPECIRGADRVGIETCAG